MSAQTLTDVALAVDELIDDIGRELFAKGISEGEADQRRADAEAESRPQRLVEHGRKAEEDETLRMFKDEDGKIVSPPHEDWVRGTVLLDEDVHESETERIRRFIDGTHPRPVERWVECWLPPDLAGDRESTGSGLVPIPPREITHGERCLLLSAVLRKYGRDVDNPFDPDKVSFLYANERGQGHGSFAILVHMVEGLTGADAPVLMRMVEKVRKKFAKQVGGKKTNRVKARKPRGATVNQRMIEELIKGAEDVSGWTANQWAKHLKCGRSTVVETAVWKELSMSRNQERAMRAVDRRRDGKTDREATEYSIDRK